MLDVGHQVVCIKDDWYAGGDPRPYVKRWYPNLPIKGMVYTIRAFTHRYNSVYIKLEELVNPIITEPPGINDEGGFTIKFFRPVRPTSIDCFTQILVTPPKQLIKETT